MIKHLSCNLCHTLLSKAFTSRLNTMIDFLKITLPRPLLPSVFLAFNNASNEFIVNLFLSLYRFDKTYTFKFDFLCLCYLPPNPSLQSFFTSKISHEYKITLQINVFENIFLLHYFNKTLLFFLESLFV